MMSAPTSIPSTAGATNAEHVERVTGIEPAFSAWEADVLPLNYTRVLVDQEKALVNAYVDR